MKEFQTHNILDGRHMFQLGLRDLVSVVFSYIQGLEKVFWKRNIRGADIPLTV